MKAAFLAVAWCALMCGSSCTSAASAQDMPFTIPGTGVTMVLPPDVGLSRVGASLVDARGEITFTFSTAEEKYDAAEDAVWRGIYPREAGKVGHLPRGKLRLHSRDADGGAWDGLMLTAARDGRSLQVMLNYKGNSPEVFEILKQRLLTLTWNPAQADPEIAMGVNFDFEGLKHVPAEISWISYNSTGLMEDKGTAVQVMALPGSASKEAAVFPSQCEKTLSAALFGAKHSPVVMNTLPTYSYCELWTEPVAAEGKYVAMVRLETGGLLTLWGTSAPEDFAGALPVFRRGVKEMRVLRAP